MAEGQQVAQKTNTMAILGLIFAFVFPLLGLIFSIVAKGQIKKTGEGGAGLATAGLIISIIVMVIGIIIAIISTVIAASTVTEIYNTYPSYYR
jgi:heme/copper-type cytochrome/quinol oxidase subunit 2